jgi:hypothetical protein
MGTGSTPARCRPRSSRCARPSPAPCSRRPCAGVERPAPDRLRPTFDGDAEIEDLIARESSCCSFFDVEPTATRDGLVRVPAARVAVLDGLARRAVG